MTLSSNAKTNIILGSYVSLCLGILGVYTYSKHKQNKLMEKEAEENSRLAKEYIEKLTPEQVERIEMEKIELKKKEVELQLSEAELKKTVADFKTQIQSEIETKVMTDIHDDMRNTFDTWSAKFETRLENKVDNVVSRIDNLSDKYGGVKSAGSSAPTISVVNAPNN